MGNLITPYLPRVAEQEARSWMNGGRPAFVKAMDHNVTENGCPNCGGIGVVYVVFAKAGPFHSAPTSGVGTWFDGDGRYGKGWYNVDRTLGYQCPECKGVPKDTGRYVLPPRQTPAIIERLAKEFGKKERLR